MEDRLKAHIGLVQPVRFIYCESNEQPIKPSSVFLNRNTFVFLYKITFLYITIILICHVEINLRNVNKDAKKK